MRKKGPNFDIQYPLYGISFDFGNQFLSSPDLYVWWSSDFLYGEVRFWSFSTDWFKRFSKQCIKTLFTFPDIVNYATTTLRSNQVSKQFLLLDEFGCNMKDYTSSFFVSFFYHFRE